MRRMLKEILITIGFAALAAIIVVFAPLWQLMDTGWAIGTITLGLYIAEKLAVVGMRAVR
jgi:hypothetical protein